MTVKRYYEIETDELELDDVTTIEVNGKRFTATAILNRPDGMLFIFDEIIETHAMNSDIRKRLQELADTIPEKIKENMIPFENGDLLTLPTLSDMKELVYFNDERNRDCGGQGKTDWRWLKDVASASDFAVAIEAGYAACNFVSHTGVCCRPLVLFRTKSPCNIAAE